MAHAIADAVGAALGSRPGTVWVTLQVVPETMYAENGQTEAVCPVFLKVTHAELPNLATLSEQAKSLANAVGAALGRSPGLVHIEYAPQGKGRIAFGGSLLK